MSRPQRTIALALATGAAFGAVGGGASAQAADHNKRPSAHTAAAPRTQGFILSATGLGSTEWTVVRDGTEGSLYGYDQFWVDGMGPRAGQATTKSTQRWEAVKGGSLGFGKILRRTVELKGKDAAGRDLEVNITFQPKEGLPTIPAASCEVKGPAKCETETGSNGGLVLYVNIVPN